MNSTLKLLWGATLLAFGAVVLITDSLGALVNASRRAINDVQDDNVRWAGVYARREMGLPDTGEDLW